jgi:glucans biosynthesis protein
VIAPTHEPIARSAAAERMRRHRERRLNGHAFSLDRIARRKRKRVTIQAQSARLYGTWTKHWVQTQGAVKICRQPMGQDLIHEISPRLDPRCGALTRAGTACQRPAMHGRRRCRLHGGLSPGAPRGMENGNFRNGNWTAEAVEERRWLRSLLQLFAHNRLGE